MALRRDKETAEHDLAEARAAHAQQESALAATEALRREHAEGERDEARRERDFWRQRAEEIDRRLDGAVRERDKAIVALDVGDRARARDRDDARGERRAADERAAVWNSTLQPAFNVRVRDRFDASSSAVLRALDESDRSVQKSAESTSM